MSLLEAIILGIIQGLTEFLPVSSSGHLELGKALFGDESVPEESLLFTVVVHGATALSTIVIFWKDIVQLVRGLFKFKWNVETQFVFMIALSMIPVAIVGIFFEETVESLFTGRVGLVGFMLLVTAALLFLTHYSKPKGGDINPSRAFLIGIAQAIAVLPGISRSGSTIATSLLLGVDRVQAARFSFLMVLPPIIGAMILKVKDVSETGAAANVDWISLVVGFIAAFISGAFACRWMIRIVQRSKLSYFAIYCVVVGIIAVVVSLV